MSAAVIIFDDQRARRWEPFALTRPIGELMLGSLRLTERLEQVSGLRCVGHITAEHLSGFREASAAPVAARDELPSDERVVYWCSRAIPYLDQERLPLPEGRALYEIDGAAVGCVFEAGEEPPDAFLHELDTAGLDVAETIPVEGQLLESIWELVSENPAWITRDVSHGASGSVPRVPSGVFVDGDHPLNIGEGVRIEPPVFFDTREGPIQVEDGVELRSGTRLAGPAFVGPNSRLLGGLFAALSAGPYSYLRGEVTDTVVLGYSNKAHDGYLGHSYIGRWVNLGAFTTNSDLKNNYHEVRVWTPDGVQGTGQLKVGCFLGDHVKTGIGLLLNTGTVVGAGSNLFGAMPPKHVAPFSWGDGSDLREYRLESFLDTAERTMARRGVEVDDGIRRWLRSCWEKGRAECA